MSGHSVKRARYLGRLRDLMLTLYLKQNTNNRRRCRNNGRFCIKLQNIPNFCYQCSVSTKVKSEQEQNITAISGHVVSNIHCPALIVFKTLYATLWVIVYSPRCQTYPRDGTLPAFSLLYNYEYGRCSEELYSLVPPSQTFRAITRHAILNGGKPSH